MFGWMRKKILFVVAFISHRLYSTPLRIREWVLIRLFRQSLSYTVVKDDLSNQANKVAILAVYPRIPMFDSVKRSILLLKNQGVSVVLIVNSNSSMSSWVDALKSEVDTLLIRPNIGRDFGAYQSGINFLKSKGVLQKTTALFLLNDSVYYTPISLTKLNDFLALQKSWKSLFLNFQYKIHAQSFFLSFGREILDSQAFEKFWNDYYPTSIRRRVVVKGELRLTKCLLHSGFRVTPFIDSQIIEEALNNNLMSPSEEFSALGEFFYSNSGGTDSKIYGAQRIELLRGILDTKNPTHHLGLFTTRLLGAPLKMDIVMRGYASTGAVRECLLEAKVPAAEVEVCINEINSQGTDATGYGIRMIWKTFGFE